MKGHPSPAWGIAPGNRRIRGRRAEGPAHHVGAGRMGRAFSPPFAPGLGSWGGSWGVAPGWDGAAPWACRIRPQGSSLGYSSCQLRAFRPTRRQTLPHRVAPTSSKTKHRPNPRIPFPTKKAGPAKARLFLHWLIPQTTGVTPGLGIGVGVKEESHFRVSSGARSSLLLRTCSQVTRLPV